MAEPPNHQFDMTKQLPCKTSESSPYKLMSIQQLRQENKKLKELHNSCQDQLEKLRETGKNHEAEIDTLLKFNERLLGIIQNEFNSATKNRISSDLQIIAQDNEVPDLPVSQNFKNKFGGQAARLGGNFQQQEMEGFEEDEEEQIYNQDMQNNLPIKSPKTDAASEPVKYPSQQKLALPAAGKTPKLDKVFEMQNKDMQVSVNLSNSAHNSFSTSIKKDPRQFINQERIQKKEPKAEPNVEFQQLKQMIKEYKEEFETNSAEYEQICAIIHNDLLNDLEEFQKLQQESRVFFQEHSESIDNLRGDLNRFKPVNELIRVMRDINVPPATERLLHQRIISKHM